MRQEKCALAKEAEGFAEQRDDEFFAQHGHVPKIRHAADAAHLDGESDQPVGQHSDAINHEVHHHGVVGVLGAAQPGFHDRESRLHEHDQEASDQRPHKVDGDLVLSDLVGKVADGKPLGLGGLIGDGIGNGYIGNSSR